MYIISIQFYLFFSNHFLVIIVVIFVAIVDVVFHVNFMPSAKKSSFVDISRRRADDRQPLVTAAHRRTL